MAHLLGSREPGVAGVTGPEPLAASRRVKVPRPRLSSTVARVTYGMESTQSINAEPTIESQPEPKPIRRLEDAVINRIAAGEVMSISF